MSEKWTGCCTFFFLDDLDVCCSCHPQRFAHVWMKSDDGLVWFPDKEQLIRNNLKSSRSFHENQTWCTTLNTANSP